MARAIYKQVSVFVNNKTQTKVNFRSENDSEYIYPEDAFSFGRLIVFMVSNWNIASKLVFFPVNQFKRFILNHFHILLKLEYLRFVEKKHPDMFSSIEFPNTCKNDDNYSMFLLLGHMLKHKNKNDVNWSLFGKLKNLITKLVVVKPECRMKLEDAGIKLEDLNKNEITNTNDSFTLLDPSLQTILNDDVATTTKDTPTQNSYGLMDDLRLSRILTSSMDDELNLTQRNTSLCVTYSAMRLLSFALLEFLKRTEIDEQALSQITEEVLHGQFIKGQFIKGHFIKQLLKICCFVISPRSMTGLNHAHLDEIFQINTQVQNIRESVSKSIDF